MKIDTPQILWHNDSEGNGKAAPLYSISLLPFPDRTIHSSSNTPSAKEEPNELLATAGNTSEINLWKLSFTATRPQQQPNTIPNATTTTPQQPTPSKPQRILYCSKSPGVTHHLSLTRHERSVNALSFSPMGTHLASAGDQGSLVMYSVPHSHRTVPTQTHGFWRNPNLLRTENDLLVKTVPTHTQDVMDVSWSRDERHLVLGTLDHTVLVIRHSVVPATNGQPTSLDGWVDEWTCVFRNTQEHTQYVQGVAFDPSGVYVASQGSDRTVRVWMRDRKKGGGSSVSGGGGGGGGGRGKKKVLGTVDRNSQLENTTNDVGDNHHHQQQTRWEGNLELVPKPKVLKYRTEQRKPNPKEEAEQPIEGEEEGNKVAPSPKKHHLFADESTVESFFRRLAWTVDGAFLITPASIWQGGGSVASLPSFAVYLFARHCFEGPCKVLAGLDKPAVVVRPNPVLFQLPPDAQLGSKENVRSSPSKKSTHASLLPYRSLFAVLTLDTVLIYDTYHPRPLLIARELHYAGLTDCTWSSNGHNLTICSTDGYVSMISFEEGELGEVYAPISTAPPTPCSTTTAMCRNDGAGTVPCIATPSPTTAPLPSGVLRGTIPPCAPGQTTEIVAPPSKKARVGMMGEEDTRRVTPVPGPMPLKNNSIMCDDSSLKRGIKRDAECLEDVLEQEDDSRDTVVVDMAESEDEEDDDVKEDGGGLVDQEDIGLYKLRINQQQQIQSQAPVVNTLVPVRKKKKKRVQPTLLQGK